MSTKKICSLTEIIQITDQERRNGKRIVATNGCFDLVHVGHIRNLEDAKRHGDVLVVGINSDSSVQKNKGPLRPIIPERERAELIASLKPVDYVFIFNGKTTDSWIKKVKPHVHIKAEDATLHPDFESQKRALESQGGVFKFVKLHKGRSTSEVIARILERYK